MIVKPLRQRHIEVFMRECEAHDVDPTGPFKGLSLTQQIVAIGVINRAAATAEMLNGAVVDDLEPWQAGQLTREILSAVLESLEIPKALSSEPPNTPPTPSTPAAPPS